ncbi:hypothetical protein [Mycobacterium sp. 1274761.0]|uniref:hypothetical protein n=1 Tax=Mycobacterium sp. 1274761.0 TaxID=1834077 RepID=UPI0007FF7E1D|nr:hypothetical protein [Mycobacterium sp. 1274761.0]OBK79475.1 hypothetical protein A5651_23810 [Mycobacterium sp. 1274761.0]
MTNPPPPHPPGGGYPPPGQGNYPPPGQGGYPPPPPPGGYPPPPQQGGYPPTPPPSGYPPPPQQGGYPPPPPGAPGYPPGQPGYPPAGPGYGGPQAFNVGEAFSWAWNKFSKNAGPLIVATLVYGLITIVLQVVINLLEAAVSPGASSYTSDSSGFSFAWSPFSGGPVAILISIVGWVVSLIVNAAIQSAYIGGVLDIANGQQVSVGSFFRPRNIGQVIVAGLIVGIITTVGFFLCVIPSLLASIMLLFTVVALLDRNLSAVDAVKTSFDTSKANFGNAFLTWLVFVVTILVGALVCGIGLLVAVPVATLFLVYSWRRITGGQVAPLTP